jgi:hypothetical protein
MEESCSERKKRVLRWRYTLLDPNDKDLIAAGISVMLHCISKLLGSFVSIDVRAFVKTGLGASGW